MNYSELIPGCSHFTWHDALFLPSWKTHHTPSQDEIDNLTRVFQKLEVIRDFLGCPINVHCAIRPILNNPSSPHNGEDYNQLVGGASHSAHRVGLAVDWNPVGMTCDEGKAKLMAKLQEFDIRMENNGQGASWIHIDLIPAHPNRYFIP